MFFPVTRAGQYEYLLIARGHRDGETVRQQTLLSLGRLDVLKTCGQLDTLLRATLRVSEPNVFVATSLHGCGVLQENAENASQLARPINY